MTGPHLFLIEAASPNVISVGDVVEMRGLPSGSVSRYRVAMVYPFLRLRSERDGGEWDPSPRVNPAHRIVREGPS